MKGNISHSSGNDIEDPSDPFLAAEKLMPPVKSVFYASKGNQPIVVYPTRKMKEEILTKQNELLRQHGFNFLN